MVTSAPATAAPCSSVMVPRMEAVTTCARAATEVQRRSATRVSREPIMRHVAFALLEFENRMFMRLPLEEIWVREKQNENCAPAAITENSFFCFTPQQKRKTNQPLRHYGT